MRTELTRPKSLSLALFLLGASAGLAIAWQVRSAALWHDYRNQVAARLRVVTR